MARDRVFDRPLEHIVDFAFGDDVAKVFPDMIRRSVPGYETVVPLSALIAARHVAPGSNAYDLGCSLGATSLALLRYCRLDFRLHAVDNAPAMLARARESLPDDPRLHLVAADVRDVELRDASAVLMNYTLQFVPEPDRTPLLAKIRAGCRDDAAVIVSEKIRFADPSAHAYFDDIHLDFKRANGYSELEISQKRTALEEVMRPDDVDAHLERFARAGFSRVDVWFRCLNWASFLARP